MLDDAWCPEVLPDGSLGFREAVIFGVPLGNCAEALRFLGGDFRNHSPAGRGFGIACLNGRPRRQSILATIAAGALTRVVIIPIDGSGAECTLYTVTSDV